MGKRIQFCINDLPTRSLVFLWTNDSRSNNTSVRGREGGSGIGFGGGWGRHSAYEREVVYSGLQEGERGRNQRDMDEAKE